MAAVLLLSAATCRSEERKPMTNSTPHPDNQTQALSHELGVPIPNEATVLGVKRESGVDDLIRVKFSLPSGALDRFAARLPIKLDSLRPGVGRLGTDDGFWNPHAMARIRSGSKALSDGHYLLIGIADGPDGTVVFLAKLGT
jgi:hypothetical protein